MQSTSHTSRRTNQGTPFYRTLCMGRHSLVGPGIADASDVSARELHEFLEVGTDYRHWFQRMCEYGFTKDEDFTRSFLTGFKTKAMMG